MILYHGTSAEYLESILKHGLQPRNKTGNSNYDGEELSKENLVYLTKTFPFAYAYSIPNIEKLLILKVKVDRTCLYPDEDFIERVYFIKGVQKSLKEIDPRDYKKHYVKSLNMFRSVCTDQVLPEQILDYKVLDASDHEYHCAVGAQGNSHLSKYELKNNLNTLESSKLVRCEKFLKLLFDKGWPKLKKEILKLPPSSVLETKSEFKIKLKDGQTHGVLVPPNKMVDYYVCNTWRSNVKSPPEVYDERFKHLLHVKREDVMQFI